VGVAAFRGVPTPTRRVAAKRLRGDEDAVQATVEAHLQRSWRRYVDSHAEQPGKQ
jgi:hypothetical protein